MSTHKGTAISGQELQEAVIYEDKPAISVYELSLSIPSYQRIYVWREEHVKTLLNDIANATVDNYFIGTVVLHEIRIDNKKHYDIVDGQQRLVTIALIQWELYGETEELPKQVKSFLECKYTSSDALSNIRRNYEIIRKQLKDPMFKEKIKTNIKKLHMGVLRIKNQDNLDLAFTFFSNTNSKGKRLTDYDLLKPHHLRYIPSDLEQQQQHLAAKWDNMINSARSIEQETEANKSSREMIPYIRVMELLLYRLRKWQNNDGLSETIDHYIKREFEAAPIIDEIPPFGEQFHFGEPIQGGQHFFAYVDHFVERYRHFELKTLIHKTFGINGSASWYGTVAEALTFCYFLKFGESYIKEATMAIIRYISIIRFCKGRAYKPTITDWARRSKIVMAIDKATSPTFFLAKMEELLDNPPIDSKLEQAEKGVRRYYLDCCEDITKQLSEKTTVNYYKNYYDKRYTNISIHA